MTGGRTSIAVAVALGLGACDSGDPEAAVARGERLADALDTAGGQGDGDVQDITITVAGCDYLEIDTLQVAGSDKDANLCSPFSNVTPKPAACSTVSFTNPAFDLDNPNLPGSAAAFTAGDGAVYCDWADLDLARHWTPFSDLVNTTADDSFQSGACVVDGHKATPKADIGNIGLAASTDGQWMYIGWERFKTDGNERLSLIATDAEIDFDTTASCATPTPLTDLTAGDLRVDLSVSGLAVIHVYVYEGPDETNLDMTAVLQHPGWVENTSPTAVVKALNVAAGAKTADDAEKGILGNTLASAQFVEVAMNTVEVLGAGCGVTLHGQFVSTASDSQGQAGSDANKDWAGPFTFSFGDIATTVTTYQSCTPGELAYEVEATLGGEPIDFEADAVTIDLDVDCDDDTLDAVLTDVDPSGTLDLGDPSADASCTVSANVSGSGALESCENAGTSDVTVYPPLDADGTLDQDCDGTLTFDGTLTSASDAGATFDWSFAIPNATTQESSDEDGSVDLNLLSGVSFPVTVSATLTVTDNQLRATSEGSVACDPVEVTPSVTVYEPITVATVATSDDATCTDGEAALDEVAFDVVISGGSGTYDLDFGELGDAVLNASCADATDTTTPPLTCSFGLGTDFCADGTVSLDVADSDPGAVDTECADAGDSIRAVRTSTLDVDPEP